MSIAALKTLSVAEADQALAATLLALGSGLPVSSEFDAISTSILSEARTTLKIRKDDRSYRASLRLREFLSAEVRRRLVQGHDRRESLVRLGMEGELPTSAYKMTRAPMLGHELFKHERWAVVQNYVRKADLTQHINHHPHPGKNLKQISLFATRTTGGSGSYWTLIVGERTGRDLELVNVWRLFPQVIDFSRAVTVLDLLMLFADRYGANLDVDGVPQGKILQNITLTDGQEFGTLDAKVTENDVIACFIGDNMGTHHVILLGYTIRMKQYLEDVNLFS